MKHPIVVLLAGGIGKSFAPFKTNKVIFPLMGKPCIYHALSMLESSGFTDVCVVCNEENKEIISTYPKKTLKITLSLQENPNGMADALLGVKKIVNGKPMLVMNAVDFVEPKLYEEIVKNITKDPSLLLVGKKVTEHTLAGYFLIQNDLVRGIVEKPEKGKEPSDLINLVFHYIKDSQDLFSILEKTESKHDDVYEEALSFLLQKDGANYIRYDGAWSKLKYPHFVLSVMDQLLENISSYIHPSATISKTAVIEGNVYIDEGVKILDYAVVKGPCYIGRNAVIGTHALVRSSSIEELAVVGSGSEVARSYIGPSCMLHHNFVGDSVLERNINPSYGTCFTNMRLDKKEVVVYVDEKKIQTTRKKLGACVAKDVFFGANCTVMPGVTIGSNSRIFPATVVNRSCKSNSIIGKE